MFETKKNPFSEGDHSKKTDKRSTPQKEFLSSIERFRRGNKAFRREGRDPKKASTAELKYAMEIIEEKSIKLSARETKDICNLVRNWVKNHKEKYDNLNRQSEEIGIAFKKYNDENRLKFLKQNSDFHKAAKNFKEIADAYLDSVKEGIYKDIKIRDELLNKINGELGSDGTNEALDDYINSSKRETSEHNQNLREHTKSINEWKESQPLSSQIKKIRDFNRWHKEVKDRIVYITKPYTDIIDERLTMAQVSSQGYSAESIDSKRFREYTGTSNISEFEQRLNTSTNILFIKKELNANSIVSIKSEDIQKVTSKFYQEQIAMLDKYLDRQNPFGRLINLSYAPETWQNFNHDKFIRHMNIDKSTFDTYMQGILDPDGKPRKMDGSEKLCARVLEKLRNYLADIYGIQTPINST